MPDPSVIAAVEAAVAADPDNTALRTHLVGLLVESAEWERCLDHARLGLQAAPADLTLLDAAVQACRALGRGSEADGYDEVLTALGGGVRHNEAGNAESRVVPDTADELLASWDETDPIEEVEVGNLTVAGVRLADVGGMEDVKKRLDTSFLAPMSNPELGAAFGKALRGGLLLWGPPGCGKTFLARALAGELGASFYTVGLADVLDMWIGSSERNLRSIFEAARRNSPCLLFLDEIDALGQKRTQLRGGGAAMRGVVNQLLAELDGVTSDNDGLFVLAATNHLWDVDPALLRPGRFDRKVLVLPPDLDAREAIVRIHLRGRPAEGLEPRRIAKMTSGYSGADLALICDEATEAALADSIETGTIRPIRQRDLERAARAVQPSIGSWMETAKNFALFSNDAGSYDDLLAYLKSKPR
jgi:SpoVK/Ycf46/Vps4 family AAA+-type ATPase